VQRPVLRPKSWRVLSLRIVQLNLGLLLFGVSISMMLRANVGLGPWDVFHQGVALRTPLTVGQAMIVAGFALLLFSIAVARVRPGLGTVANMTLVGLWVDTFLARPWFPAASGPWDGAGLFALGLVLNGVATGVYITAGLGAGPRDGFSLGLSKLSGIPVRRVRTAVEVVVVTTGWLLGGAVGLGTIAFALTIGPLMQTSIRVFGGVEARYGRAGDAIAARRAVAPVRSVRP
jgi:uncharacterized membrane protein YczE